MTKTQTGIAPPSSLAGWQARALHTITCPSGQRLRFRLRGLATILEHGDLPDDLTEVALEELMHTTSDEFGRALSGAAKWAGGVPDDREETLARIRRFAEFQRSLACDAIEQLEVDGEGWVPVTLTNEDLAELPEDDVAMVAEIVMRLRARDARGVRIGVEPLDRFATFREFHRGIACTGDQDCEGCAKVIDVVSSLDVGAV